MQIRFAVLTISDRSSRHERPDASGPALVEAGKQQGWVLVEYHIVPDEKDQIQEKLIGWCDGNSIDLILTTGGTGFSPRDVTPEATMAIVERPTPGLAEAMRQESLKITPHAMLSRAAAGIRRRTLIVNFPGSPKAAMENLRTLLPVLPHAVELLRDETTAEANHGKLNKSE